VKLCILSQGDHSPDTVKFPDNSLSMLSGCHIMLVVVLLSMIKI